MSLSDDQQDAILKALKGAGEAMEYLVSGVKRNENMATLRARMEELELYLKRAKGELRF